MAHLVCVGDVMVDVIARLPTPLAHGSDTPAPVAFLGGGAAANVAAWAVAAGSDATLVARVGDDPAGEDVIEGLRAAGVRLAVDVDAHRPTGCCIVLVDPAGERTMVPSNGANAGLGELDVATTLPAAADALYVSGYALLDDGARPFALGALALARERNWAIAVDVASAAPLARVGSDVAAEWLRGPLTVFANEDETRVLTGASGRPGAIALASRFGDAVVKLGARGALWSDGSRTEHVPAQPVDVVDTTGAGDAFAAGFLAARLSGATPAGCLARGAELAAQAVQRFGARPG